MNSMGRRQTKDKDSLGVGLNLEKTKFMANETGKIIHYGLRCCIPGRDVRFTLSAISL
jgi:hypothetical protein